MPDRERCRLVLASTSPRRRQLLEEAGYAFTVEAPSIDERARPGEAPEALTERLALEKARSVAARSGPGCCVIGADTVVVLDGDILGKPSDAEHAQQMLLRLAGETHRVLTGFALIRTDDGRAEHGCEISYVRMREVDVGEARAYARSGEPLDKAGGYAVQGEAGRFVASIEGSRENVIGLPVDTLAPRLARFGVVPE